MDKRAELLKLNTAEITKKIIDDRLSYEDILYLIDNNKISDDIISYIIEKDVDTVRQMYEIKQNQTKYKYFESLKDNVTPEDFAKVLTTIWGTKAIIKSMDKMEQEFNSIVYNIKTKTYNLNVNQHQDNNLNKYSLQKEEYIKNQSFLNSIKESQKSERFKLLKGSHKVDLKEIIKNEDKLKKYVLKLYDKNYKNTISFMDEIQKQTYLEKLVDKYNNTQKIIPYFNKDGSVKCYNTLATYNSMLYNVNLTNDAWDMTINAGKDLGIGLYVVKAHPFCCPHCAVHNGNVYTEDELEIAVKNGLKHPNCKCDLVVYLDNSFTNVENYNTEEWHYKYQVQQRIKGLELEKSRLRNDLKIYEMLDNYGLADETKSKINQINKKIRQQKEDIKVATEFYQFFPEYNYRFR